MMTMVSGSGGKNALRLIGGTVIVILGLRVDHHTYDVFVEMLADEIVLPAADRGGALDALARQYAARLEHYCLRAPYQWFNFYEFWDEPSPRTTTASRSGSAILTPIPPAIS